MSNPENPSTWLPEPAANRAPNAVDWTDPGAPYVSSLAYRYHRDEHCTGVDVIKAQYAIELELRLRMVAAELALRVIRIRDLEIKIADRDKQITELKAAGDALGSDTSRPGWKDRWARWMRAKGY